MSASTQTTTPKYIIGGFDGHGSLTSVARAREINLPLGNVIVKYPDTSPELMPKLLYSMALYNTDIEILDIPINIKNPTEWLNIMSLVAQNNKVVIYDHHTTNLKFVNQLPTGIKLIQFDNTVSMAKALVQTPENFNIALIGSITDRDPALKQILSIEEINKLTPIANAYDVVIRQNLSQAVKNVYEQGYNYLVQLPSQVQYPPSLLSKQAQILKRQNDVALVDLTNVNLQQWTWKTLDEIAFKNNFSYVVAISQVTDRQLNTVVPVIFVIKYWLADVPSPMPIIRSVIGNRKMIGHEDGFSISATSLDDARALAENIYNTLVSQWSNSARLISSDIIANAIQNDYRNILAKLTEILQKQQEMYAEYLQLKKEQVELLKSSNEKDRRRYD